MYTIQWLEATSQNEVQNEKFKFIQLDDMFFKVLSIYIVPKYWKASSLIPVLFNGYQEVASPWICFDE